MNGIFRQFCFLSRIVICSDSINLRTSSFVYSGSECTIKNINYLYFFPVCVTLNYVSYPKNPHIAKFFMQLGLAEDFGTGIRKIFKFNKLYSGSKPPIEEGDIFIVKLPLHEKKNKGKVPDKLSSNQEKIQMCMLKNPKVSMTQIAHKLGISNRKTLDNINKLKVLGFVNRVGSPKGGSWIVKEK